MTTKILIVEDEPLIRLGIAATLEQAGFTTVEAADADEAVLQLESDSEIRVVVTDVDMPGSMDGLQLSHAIRKRWPPVHLIVVSGKIGVSVGALPARARFISKPFAEVSLINAISEMVSGR